MAKTLIIDDSTSNDVLFPKDKGRGGEPRDILLHPQQMMAAPTEMDLIPDSEWEDRIKEQDRLRTSLAHIRQKMANGSKAPSLNQGPVGYCWSHSVTHAAMLARGVAMQEYVPLSAYSIAAEIKKGRDEGGWCGLAWEFLKNKGVNSQKMWAQGRRDYQTLIQKPEVIAERKKYRSLEDWVDIARPVYSKQLTWKQLISCLLRGDPCALDFNWWGHSVAGLQAVIVEPGSIGVKIWNSWGDEWGEDGEAVLRGSKAVPDGAIAIRTMAA
jgi:hypothetical protein